MGTSKLRVGSLFAGIGGLELGLESTGHYETVWQVEIDDYARKVLAKHWPNVRRHDDVCTFPTDDDWSCDVICGGFPCQDLSYAGKGEGLDGQRSGLFYELARVVRLVGPRYVILENVAALLTRGMGDVLGTLVSLGYDCEWHCIPAAAVGAPHIRDRVFITGVLGNADCTSGKGGGVSRRVHKDNTYANSVSFSRRKQILADSYSQRQSGQRMLGGRISEEENQKRKANRLIAGSKGKEGHWYIEPEVGRVAARIPRRMDRLRCLGNAVVPQVAHVVGQILWEVHCGR